MPGHVGGEPHDAPLPVLLEGDQGLELATEGQRQVHQAAADADRVAQLPLGGTPHPVAAEEPEEDDADEGQEEKGEDPRDGARRLLLADQDERDERDRQDPDQRGQRGEEGLEGEAEGHVGPEVTRIESRLQAGPVAPRGRARATRDTFPRP